MASSTGERIAKILEAAEQAASAVIDDAEAQARRYLEDAQAEADRVVAERLSSLSQLSDSLVAQAEAIRQQSDRLLTSLGESAPTPAAPSQTEPPPFPSPPPTEVPPPTVPTPHLSAVEPDSELPVEPAPEPVSGPFSPPPAPAPQPPAPPTSQGTPAAARLLATQMAVSGASREEIDTRLRAGFEIEDTAPILDAILGPEG